MRKSWLYVGALLAMLFLLYCTGLGVRRAVLEAQYRAAGSDLPFTLESALSYRRIKIIYDTGEMPAVDTFIQYPEGVNVSETYSLGPEYVQAFLARLLPTTMSVTHRLRWIESGWFCLGIVAMALWLIWWRRNWWSGFVGAGFYAVALSSVIRSTGQELSRENFALPLLIFHLAFDALAARQQRKGALLACSLASALFLGAALASWDLIQFYVLVWLVPTWRGVLRGRLAEDNGAGVRWLMQTAVLVLSGLILPYYRAHGFLTSPLMLLVYGPLLAYALQKGGRWPVRPRGWGWLPATLAVMAAPLAMVALAAGAGAFTDSYGHFAELLAAKIRFLNQKPLDPSLLTFDQRIMWVPALHSANWGLTITLFPVMLCLSFIAILSTIHQVRKQRDPAVSQLVYFYGASLIAFCFFARFHVFLALFASAGLGVWAGTATNFRSWWKWTVATVLCAGLIAETVHTLRDAGRWGRSNVYYDEAAELALWLREYVAPEPVLANFGISAYIATYGKCPILLHPKFESGVIRQRVREYGESLFKDTERLFRDWAEKHGARYYVYALGEFSSVGVDQQMRYFVNAIDPPTNAAARLFEFRPAEGRYFELLWKNRKYEVFKILTSDNEMAAARLAHEANQAFLRAELKKAEELTTRSLELDPAQEQALKILDHVGSLQRQGFRYGGTTGDH